MHGEPWVPEKGEGNRGGRREKRRGGAKERPKHAQDRRAVLRKVQDGHRLGAVQE